MLALYPIESSWELTVSSIEIQFLSLSKVKDAITRNKWEAEPKGEKEDNEQTNPRHKRAKSEELPSIHEDRKKKLKPRRKGFAVTKGLPSIKEDEETEVEPKRKGLSNPLRGEAMVATNL